MSGAALVVARLTVDLVPGLTSREQRFGEALGIGAEELARRGLAGVIGLVLTQLAASDRALDRDEGVDPGSAGDRHAPELLRLVDVRVVAVEDAVAARTDLHVAEAPPLPQLDPMLVAEGLGKQLDPGLDPVALAAPYLMQALVDAPPGKEPLREVPAH